MCVVLTHVDICAECKCRHLVNWRLQVCKEQWHCIDSEYSHCNQTDVIFNGLPYKLEDVERRKNTYCKHDGYLCFGHHYIYHSKDQGFETLYQSFLLEEAP